MGHSLGQSHSTTTEIAESKYITVLSTKYEITLFTSETNTDIHRHTQNMYQ